MAEIVVNYATIMQAATDCTSTGNELQARFDQLKTDLQPLVGSWEGDAMAAWDARQREWDASLLAMKQLLARIATALPQISDGYQQTDTAVARSFGGGAGSAV